MNESNGNAVVRLVARTGLGDFEVTATARGLRSVTPLRPGRTVAERAPEGAALAHARAAAEALRRYAEGAREGYSGPFDLDAPAFPVAVWEELRAIPFGATRSYGEIAARLGVPGEARAVGAAVAPNPVCVLIPCHRVVGADGSLKGFAWGLDLKRRLLAHEAAALPLFSSDPAPA
ncbi:MAG TPA: MGMT family protein [Terriglobales bacterium]|nr:MGMT family protein [Terriglobales bacterium]